MSKIKDQVFLMDADSWIACHEERYPIDVFPGLWDCIQEAALDEIIRTPRQALVEAGRGKGGVAGWIKLQRPSIILHETKHVARRMAEVVTKFPTMTHGVDESADPWLVAHALSMSGATVVTEESRGFKRGGHPRLPEVCAAFQVRSINALMMFKQLQWKLKRA